MYENSYEESANLHTLATLLLFNCLLAQKATQLITWLQLCAFRHRDVVGTTC